MAEEIDQFSFYFEDFSTGSAWEIFNAQLVDIFENWDLPNGVLGRLLKKDELFNCEWQLKVENLSLLDRQLTVSYHAAQLSAQQSAHLDAADIVSNGTELAGNGKPQLHLDLLSMENTFESHFDTRPNRLKPHSLVSLYGLRRFVVITPTIPSTFLIDPIEIKTLLSSINVVAAEISSTVPIFLQIHDPKLNHYLGVHTSPGLRINFDMFIFEKVPSICNNLSGLLMLFKQKLAKGSMQQLPYISVSVRNTYLVKFENTEDDKEPFCEIPYGRLHNSAPHAYLVCTWPELDENTAIYTEFAPSQAPLTTMHFTRNSNFYLSNTLYEFLFLNFWQKRLEYYFADHYLDFINFVGEHFVGDIVQPRDKSRILSPPKKLAGSIKECELDTMMMCLFPNIHQNLKFNEDNKQVRINSIYPDSLIMRLSCLLATCNSFLGNIKAFAELWIAFTRKLRLLVINCIRIPDVAPGFPDSKSCLLLQKLQMLNICIARRSLSRELDRKIAKLYVKVNENVPRKYLFDDECDESYQKRLQKFRLEKQRELDIQNLVAYINLVNPQTIWERCADNISSFQPVGRQKSWGNAKLLHTDEPLYVPKILTKTGIQVMNEAKNMLSRGNDATQVMCISILYYMEAFKAANPKANIEDFIRWYTCKQRLTDLDSTNLSTNMLIIWQTIWRYAQPIPAEVQMNDFDAHNEALKVLYYLESLTIGEIYKLTVNPLLKAAVLKLKDIFAKANILDIFQPNIDKILKNLSGKKPNAEGIYQRIQKMEQMLYNYDCANNILKYSKKSDQDTFKENFKEMCLNNSSGMSISGPKNFKHRLISKEYVIRVKDDTMTGSKVDLGPQFLRAILMGGKLRLCGAFSESTSFCKENFE